MMNEWDISSLIVRSLQGEITPKEKERLTEWLEEDEANQALYERVCSRDNQTLRKNIISELHKDIAWKRVDRATKVKSTKKMIRLLKYAAVIVIPIISASIGFYWFGEKKLSKEAIVSSAGIKPGERKAELILADGRCLSLGESSSVALPEEKGVSIVKEKDGISYHGDKMDKEVFYNTLRVPRGGEFKITLQDGTLVYLNSETELRYPVTFSGEERRVYLSGEAYFEVTKNQYKPFVVEMDGNEIRVLGTEFNVRSYRDEGSMFATLVSGKVLLKSGGSESIELLPEEQGIIDASGRLEKRRVDVYPCIAWKDGNFVFRKQSLESIMKIVERWYDVEVVFQDEWCKEVSFSGNIQRYDDFKKLTEMLEVTGSVRFEVKNNMIYIVKR